MQRFEQKSLKQNLSRTEQKAASIDRWVKGHIASSRAAQKEKTARLKALREAREASQVKPRQVNESLSRAAQVERIRRIWTSDGDPADDPKRDDISKNFTKKE